MSDNYYKTRYPLRKVLETVEHSPYGDAAVLMELLECGHVLMPKQDIYGALHPNRRRCYKCSKGHPAEFNLETHEPVMNPL